MLPANRSALDATGFLSSINPFVGLLSVATTDRVATINRSSPWLAAGCHVECVSAISLSVLMLWRLLCRETPLFWAAAGCHLACARKLLDEGDSPRYVSTEGASALFRCLQADPDVHVDQSAVCQLLMKKGAIVNGQLRRR
jgi:hypothetical protein